MSKQSESEQTLEEINDQLYKRGATDGLPIIPPTDERVKEMLQGTDTPKDEVLGRLGNNDNPITTEKLASNAVMAGCVPPYMPLLEAGVRALADPASNSIQVSVSTGSWAYQWIVNGPVRQALNIQSSSGAFGPYFRANRTIARALGLAYRNTASIHPGEKDMGVMGNPFKFSLLAGENEEASPWEPYHVTHGFDTKDSTITLAGPNSIVQWFPAENTPKSVLRGMLHNTPPTMVGGENQGGDFDQTIFHLVNPYNAEELQRVDLSKDDIKEYLSDNSYRPIEEFQGDTMWGGALEGLQAEIENTMVRQVANPGCLKILTVGGAGRVNATVGPSIGGPVTKRIDFPSNWDELVEDYTLEPTWYEQSTY